VIVTTRLRANDVLKSIGIVENELLDNPRLVPLFGRAKH
jgi:hypothetical protein